ncbi:MAG: hypothetical protein HQ537_01215 [Parcubacteria group bacterium]|nr:hypothetical protein [Parcubacteria group bacterium]
MNPTAKLAKLLRTSEEVILDLEKKMNRITGKQGIIEKIVQENDEKVSHRLKELELSTDSKAEDVYQALINKAKQSDEHLSQHFHQLNFSTATGCQDLINTIKELTGNLSGFFLKEDKIKELFRLNPPKKIMESLGYDDINKMLEKENVFELFCALRFVEDGDWLNNIFFQSYGDLKKEDFEKREIKIMVLPETWSGIGQKFLEKKLHHMSHLKEVGVVFIIPVIKCYPDEALYCFFMTLHYLYEVDWHSRLFEGYSHQEDFTQKMTEALKVQVSSMPLPNQEKMSWRIMPAYLAKKDCNDPRLAEPHISPEAWHFTKAAACIDKFSQQFPDSGFDFWQGLDVVGDYFPVNNSKEENLVSFDLFDNGISLLRQIGFESKYLYHQQEALWNKIFIEYMGEEKMDRLMMENLDQGYVVL